MTFFNIERAFLRIYK